MAAPTPRAETQAQLLASETSAQQRHIHPLHSRSPPGLRGCRALPRPLVGTTFTVCLCLVRCHFSCSISVNLTPVL